MFVNGTLGEDDHHQHRDGDQRYADSHPEHFGIFREQVNDSLTVESRRLRGRLVRSEVCLGGTQARYLSIGQPRIHAV